MPIRAILETEQGAFSPEDIEAIAAAFGTVLRDLNLVDRDDDMTRMIAKLIVELAKQGERDPQRLSAQVAALVSR
jgi:hypothetical protein